MIRLGEFGRRAIRVTAWVTAVGVVVAVALGEWRRSLELGLIAFACIAALFWNDVERVDEAPDFDRTDDGG